MVLKLGNIFESPYYWYDFKVKLGGLMAPKVRGGPEGSGWNLQ
jgi:hypothetical protein